ncbi:MAG: dihydroorotase [Elusimicrobia bacterium RIFCSPLOWO2_01_FULL_59_12]|nr:MAG: dihydroorotase [Elusimicrobia bacterium RIFCSPLOWO2_01_FULL_59_12]
MIRKGHVIDPRNHVDAVRDVLIQGRHIERVARDIKAPPNAEILDAAHLIVTPGLIDIHVHLREPGQEEKETIATGTAAAAMGGFAAVACMPNTVPPLDNVSQIQFVTMKAESEGYVRVYPVGAISKGQLGKELTEFGAMVRAGCVAISDDGVPVANAKMFRRALEYARTFGLTVIDHCEEPDLAAGGVMNEGRLAAVLGLKGIPRQAEYIMVARDIALCELTGGALHLAHMSTKESVALIRQAKKRGLPVTAETAPHYFTLTEEAVADYNTLAKMNPPLRTAEDRAAVLEGLSDGTIDVIASDHAPHTAAQKSREFDFAPFGIIGLETTLPLVLTELVQKKVLSLSNAIKALTDSPARALNLPGGHLAPGAPADVTLIDLKAKHTAGTFASKSQNSPFIGRTFQGRAAATLVDGDVVMSEGRLLRKPPLMNG